MFNNKKNSQPNIFDVFFTGLMVYEGMKDIEVYQNLIQIVDADPVNPQSHQAFLEGIKKIKDPNPIDITLPAYYKALNILLENKDNQNVINFVFEVGKWHYSTQNPPKIYTQNDLLAVQNILADIDEIDKLICFLEESQKNLAKNATREVERLENLDIEQLLQLIEAPKQENQANEAIDDTIQKIGAFANRKFSFASNPVEKKFNERNLVLLRKSSDYLIKEISYKPGNRKLQELLLSLLQKIPDVDSLNVYSSILNIYQASSSQRALKLFVIEVGRWHFGKQRFFGKPNQTDEQTIQNDISVRSKRS